MADRIYIAGKMRGVPLFNFPAFDKARDLLLERGWQPVSPADLDREAGMSEMTDDVDVDIHECLRRDFIAICQCDAIAFLPGWKTSKGALAERFVGEQIGLDFYYFDPDTDEMRKES